MNSWYAINQAKDADEAEVRIYDAIGTWGVTASQFVRDIKAIKAGTIRVRINSPGGEVFDGFAIHNAIRALSANVIVHVDGLAASAGSVVALAGDEVRMAKNAYMMIHNTAGGVMGGADDMKKQASLLEKLDDTIAGIYEDKTGKDKEYWAGLMDAETWFTSEEAMKEGLIDAIDEPVKEEKPANSFDFKIYNKVPQAVLEAFGKQTNPETPAAPVAQRSETEPAKEQEPNMATATTSAPAATVAAPAPQSERDQLTQTAIENYINRGRQLGIGEGKTSEMERMKAIMEACPGNPELAIQGFVSGQSPEAVKLAFDADKRARASLAAALEEQRTENARLQAVIATGGHPGVAMAPTSQGPSIPQGLEPEVQAEMEYDANPLIRAKNPNKKHYVLFRTNELRGNVKVLNKSA